MTDKARILVYILRRDLRLADNPIFHEVARLQKQSQHAFTHFLPIYIFPANQVEIGGFIPTPAKRSPYPEARSEVAGFWRCEQLRAKFLAECVWDLKDDLASVGSDLVIRVGTVGDVVRQVMQHYAERKEADISASWMTQEEGVEEKREERQVERACAQNKVDYKLWTDEKYLVDEYVPT